MENVSNSDNHVTSGSAPLVSNNSNCVEPYNGAIVIEELKIISKEDQEKFVYVTPTSVPGAMHPLGIYPNNYELSTARVKGLAEGNNFNDKFFYIHALYRKALEEYLGEKLQLQEYSNRLLRADENNVMEQLDDEWKNFYERYSNLTTPYFSLGNNIHVERLEPQDLSVFEKAYETQSVAITEEMRDIVHRTWVTVIQANENGDTNFFVQGKSYPNDAVFIYISIQYTERFEFGSSEMAEYVYPMDSYIKNVFIEQMQGELESIFSGISIFLLPHAM